MNCINLNAPEKCSRARCPPAVLLASRRVLPGTLGWLAVEERMGRPARAGIASKAFRHRQPKPERSSQPGLRISHWTALRLQMHRLVQA